jgi:hypothetical protein
MFLLRTFPKIDDLAGSSEENAPRREQEIGCAYPCAKSSKESRMDSFRGSLSNQVKPWIQSGSSER